MTHAMYLSYAVDVSRRSESPSASVVQWFMCKMRCIWVCVCVCVYGDDDV